MHRSLWDESLTSELLASKRYLKTWNWIGPLRKKRQRECLQRAGGTPTLKVLIQDKPEKCTCIWWFFYVTSNGPLSRLYLFAPSSTIRKWLFSHTSLNIMFSNFSLFLRCYLFIFRERGRERNIIVREKHRLLLVHALTGNQTCTPRHVPWPGIELATFCFVEHSQPTEPHQSGLQTFLSLLTW